MEHTTIDVNKEGLVCLGFQDKWGFFLDNLPHQCFIWNSKYHTKIQLPPIPDFQYLSKKLIKCIVTPITNNTHSLHIDQKRRNNSRFNGYLCNVFLFLKRELCFLVCRPPLYVQWETIKFDKSWTPGLCDAVEFLNNKCIYTLCMNGKLGIIEDLPKISMTAPFLLSRAPTDSVATYRRRQLVSYQNQLLLVQQKLGSPSVMEVWNVDLTIRQFNRIFDLNGMYIFLSRGYSSAIYAPVQGNCVYFTEDDNDHCISKRDELYAFDFKDQSIFMSPQENICVHCNPNNSIPSLMPVIYKTQQNAGDDDLKNVSDELTHVKWHNAKEQIVQPNNNICDLLSLDLQREISQYLLIQDAHSYMNFRSVSKSWKSLAPRLCWKVDVNTTHSSGSLQDSVWLLSINQEDGLCTLYNPFTNLTCYMNNNELAGCEIRYSKNGVLLVSRGPRSLFFVEPFRKRIIQLPDQTEDYCCDTMSFSASPFDSSDWMIFGIVSVDKYRVRISYLRAKDEIWTSMIMDNEGIPFLLSCSSPVYSGSEFFVIGQDGNVGVFGFFQGDVYCYWQIKQIAQLYKPRLACVVCRHFLVKCDEQNLLYSVIVGGQTREHVRVYQLNFLQNTVKLVKEFKTWLIFISEASSFFTRSTKSAGLDDALLFPKFNSNGDYIHYSLKDAKFKAGKEKCNDICSRKELLGRVWIHSKYLAPHVGNYIKHNI